MQCFSELKRSVNNKTKSSTKARALFERKINRGCFSYPEMSKELQYKQPHWSLCLPTPLRSAELKQRKGFVSMRGNCEHSTPN